MTRRPTVGGHEREHRGQVEAGRVRRGQVAGHQHERMSGIGHARHRHAEAGRDRSLPHVIEVGDAFGEVRSGGGECLPEPGERLEDRPGRR